MALDLVQRVTGHKTVEIVLKHYFRPGREDFKQRILAAMPTLLGGPTGKTESGTTEAKTIDVEVTEIDTGAEAALRKVAGILEGVTGKANQDCVSKAAEMIEKAKNWYDQPSRAAATA